ncbi:hypothetical protein P3T25_003779 [Paraburkholderia sp. GAS32]
MGKGVCRCGNCSQREAGTCPPGYGVAGTEWDQTGAGSVSRQEITSHSGSATAECCGPVQTVVMPVMTYADLLPYLVLPMAGSF